MKPTSILAAAALCAGLALPANASAQPNYTDAANITELNMMLMTTSLRCRHGYHDFRAEFRAFGRNNLAHLNRANAQLRQSFHAQYGNRIGEREFDRFGTMLANQYGNGHPWMNCRRLKSVMADLAFPLNHDELADAAHWLVTPPARGYRR